MVQERFHRGTQAFGFLLGNRLYHVVAVRGKEEKLPALRIRLKLHEIDTPCHCVHVVLASDPRQCPNLTESQWKIILELNLYRQLVRRLGQGRLGPVARLLHPCWRKRVHFQGEVEGVLDGLLGEHGSKHRKPQADHHRDGEDIQLILACDGAALGGPEISGGCTGHQRRDPYVSQRPAHARARAAVVQPGGIGGPGLNGRACGSTDLG
mmetsp:Transcript_110590/g.253247  ORF Transcript_110590/g.253247 Transcript_110590/m.253247 type:complete len:209 (-) Transcript_110590:381-1007(-)